MAEGRLGGGKSARAVFSTLHAFKRCGDPLTVVLRGALRRESGHGNVQRGGYLGDRSPVLLAGADEVHDRVVNRRCVNGCNLDSATHPDLEQSPSIERPYRLAYDRARNPELLAQLALWRQRGSRSQALRDDPLKDLLRHFVRETWLPLESLQRRRMRGAIGHNVV